MCPPLSRSLPFFLSLFDSRCSFDLQFEDLLVSGKEWHHQLNSHFPPVPLSPLHFTVSILSFFFETGKSRREKKNKVKGISCYSVSKECEQEDNTQQ